VTALSTAHHTIVVKRVFDAPPKHVFAAWRDPLALQKWYLPGDSTWSSRIVAHDFRVGGVKQIEFGPRGEAPFTEDCRYEDIVPDRRLCFSMTIARSNQRITTSMITALFHEAGRRTELTVTDQLVILDGSDTRDDRERGWGETLDKLPHVL
jgi:uncharacterized protein YndB with AHSA1/START domain